MKRKINYEFATPTYIPDGLVEHEITPPYINPQGWLIGVTLLSDMETKLQFILCVRQRQEIERKHYLEDGGLAATHKALYLYISKEEAATFISLAKMYDTSASIEVDKMIDAFVKEVAERIGYTEINESMEPKIYGFAAYDLNDRLIAFNRLFPPYDTLVACNELINFYRYTSGREIKKFSKKHLKKAGF